MLDDTAFSPGHFFYRTAQIMLMIKTDRGNARYDTTGYDIGGVVLSAYASLDYRDIDHLFDEHRQTGERHERTESGYREVCMPPEKGFEALRMIVQDRRFDRSRVDANSFARLIEMGFRQQTDLADTISMPLAAQNRVHMAANRSLPLGPTDMDPTYAEEILALNLVLSEGLISVGNGNAHLYQGDEATRECGPVPSSQVSSRDWPFAQADASISPGTQMRRPQPWPCCCNDFDRLDRDADSRGGDAIRIMGPEVSAATLPG